MMRICRWHCRSAYGKKPGTDSCILSQSESGAQTDIMEKEKRKNMKDKINLYTHDGNFHADDVFAAALLSFTADEINVVRGSEQEIPEDQNAWIVFDIGGGELDHHTPENKEANGCHPGTAIPYAACGLVWRKYYPEILEYFDCPEQYIDSVYKSLDLGLIQGIDADDNGYNPLQEELEKYPWLQKEQKNEILKASRTNYAVFQMIKDYNPPWNSEMDHYEAFLDAVECAKTILINRIDGIISRLEGRDYVQRCIDYSANHLMIMEEFAPWEGILNSQRNNPKAADIWYVVSPARRGGWNLHCVRDGMGEKNSFRHPLPEEWYGLRGEELQQASGIKTALFCHPSGFLAGAETEEDVIAMANIGISRKN